jgi:hypothetical protein
MSEANRNGRIVDDAGQVTIGTSMANVFSVHCKPTSIVIFCCMDENGAIQQPYVATTSAGFFVIGFFNWLDAPSIVNWAIIN